MHFQNLYGIICTFLAHVKVPDLKTQSHNHTLPVLIMCEHFNGNKRFFFFIIFTVFLENIFQQYFGFNSKAKRKCPKTFSNTTKSFDGTFIKIGAIFLQFLIFFFFIEKTNFFDKIDTFFVTRDRVQNRKFSQ